MRLYATLDPILMYRMLLFFFFIKMVIILLPQCKRRGITINDKGGKTVFYIT